MKIEIYKCVKCNHWYTKEEVEDANYSLFKESKCPKCKTYLKTIFIEGEKNNENL